MITNVLPQHNAEYIALVFWKQEIAKVSSITLIPQLVNSEISYIAYINIESYCDTESAYDFVWHMNSDLFLFCHDESDPENSIWYLQKNTHNSGNLSVGPYTTNFMPEFFEDYTETSLSFGQKLLPNNDSYDEEYDNYTCNSEEWDEFVRNRPIVGLDNVYYTLDEAIQHLWHINKKLQNNDSPSIRHILKKEFDHFEQQIKNWENTYGLALLEESQNDATMVSMGNVCPSLFIPHSHELKRETAGECYDDYSVTTSKREIAMSVDEYNRLELNAISIPVLRREEALTQDDINSLLNIW